MYLRYSRSSDWYVFEQPNGQLAVWHKDHRAAAAQYSAGEVRQMLDAGDFARIPGFQADHTVLLVRALQAWLKDLDAAGG